MRVQHAEQGSLGHRTQKSQALCIRILKLCLQPESKVAKDKDRQERY